MDETLQETTEQTQETEPVMAVPDDNSYLPEAGGVCYTDLYGTKNGHVVKFSLTARGWNAVDALDKLIAGVVHAEEQYHLLPYNPEQAVKQSAPAKPSSPVAPVAGAVPPPPITQAPAQAAQPAAGFGEYRIIKIDVTPRADGKAEVKMYAAGMKYPSVKMVRTAAQLVTALSATGDWQDAHFTQAASYTTDWIVKWQNGKEYEPNKFYKDVVSVTPA